VQSWFPSNGPRKTHMACRKPIAIVLTVIYVIVLMTALARSLKGFFLSSSQMPPCHVKHRATVLPRPILGTTSVAFNVSMANERLCIISTLLLRRTGCSVMLHGKLISSGHSNLETAHQPVPVFGSRVLIEPRLMYHGLNNTCLYPRASIVARNPEAQVSLANEMARKCNLGGNRSS
jgi:hypothetical protein